MLIEFSFKNYRSFRDQAVLSMEAVGLGAFKSSIMEINNLKLLRGAAIFGKNGGGKSNVIRAFWLAVQFIRNAQRTQHEKGSFLNHCIMRPKGRKQLFSQERIKNSHSLSPNPSAI